MDIDQIRTHIDNLIKEKGKNYRSLSLSIGKNEAYLHQFINKRSPVRLPEEQRRKLAMLLDVDEQELTDIKLPKTITPVSSHAKTALVEMISLNLDQSAQSTEGFFSLPAADFSNITSTSPEFIKMLRVSGDSMDPTLKDGDFVLADFSFNHFGADGLYLVRTSNHFIIRRLQQISSNELVLISDNANYKSVSLPFKKVDIAGKIIFALKAQRIG